MNLPSIILENMGEIGSDEMVSRGNTDVQRLKEFDRQVNGLIRELNEDALDCKEPVCGNLSAPLKTSLLHFTLSTSDLY